MRRNRGTDLKCTWRNKHVILARKILKLKKKRINESGKPYKILKIMKIVNI